MANSRLGEMRTTVLMGKGRAVSRKKQRTDERQQKEDGEEEGRRVSHGNGAERDGEGGISVTLTDPDVLDCSICMEPLIPPVFQCDNGHIACSTCCTKIANKCPSCSWPIGYRRCLAIEKVIESIKISCQNAQYGCKERVSYAQKLNHEETCIYAPCACPLSDCTFFGSFEQLSLHFSSRHWASARRFHYNCPFPVSVAKSEQFLVFQGEEDGLLFLLNNRTEIIGNAISVTCIGTSSSKGGFFYDVISRAGSSSLKLQSYTKFAKRQTEDSSMDFLLIPNDFNSCYGQLKLDVCIWSSREFEGAMAPNLQTDIGPPVCVRHWQRPAVVEEAEYRKDAEGDVEITLPRTKVGGSSTQRQSAMESLRGHIVDTRMDSLDSCMDSFEHHVDQRPTP